MAYRRSFQFGLVLVIFLLVASFVQCDDSDSDSDGLVGFRVRISRWFLTSKRVVQQLQERSAIEAAADQQARRAEKTTSDNSGAATLLWAVGPPADEQRQEDENPRQLARNGVVAVFQHAKQEANDAASMPVAPRPILRRGEKLFTENAMEESHTDDDEDHEHGHWHHRKHKHGGDHGGKWQRRLAACRADGERFCSQVTSDWLSMDSVKSAMPELLVCLSQHQAMLSPQCSAELSSCASFKCAADAARLCSSVVYEEPVDVSRTSWHEKKQRIISCLESRPDSLSDTCLSAINERRVRHGKPALEPTDTSREDDAPVAKPQPYEYADGYTYGYEPPRPSRHPRPPRPSDSEDVTGMSSTNNGNALPQWALIALVTISAAFLFMTALTVILLVQLKRRRQREAVMAAANSLSLPLTDVRSQFEIPYHRLDEVQLV